MAYRLTYWESAKTPDTHYALKEVRLKSIDEVFSLSLPHNRPSRTSLITLDRSDKQSNIEKIVWETGMDYPSNPVVKPTRTKSARLNKIRNRQ